MVCVRSALLPCLNFNFAFQFPLAPRILRRRFAAGRRRPLAIHLNPYTKFPLPSERHHLQNAVGFRRQLNHHHLHPPIQPPSSPIARLCRFHRALRQPLSPSLPAHPHVIRIGSGRRSAFLFCLRCSVSSSPFLRLLSQSRSSRCPPNLIITLRLYSIRRQASSTPFQRSDPVSPSISDIFPLSLIWSALVASVPTLRSHIQVEKRRGNPLHRKIAL